MLEESFPADELLLSSPLYNLAVLSFLEAWIDHVVGHDRTFRNDEGGYRGLLDALG